VYGVNREHAETCRCSVESQRWLYKILIKMIFYVGEHRGQNCNNDTPPFESTLLDEYSTVSNETKIDG
jgi:hypothetical protein